MEKTVNGMNGSLLGILAKHGLATFFAIAFLGIVVVYQLIPAADAQRALTRDREALMVAVTESLKKNSESMERMSSAVEALRTTISDMAGDEAKALGYQKSTTELLGEFTEEVKSVHEVQIKKLDKIDSQTAKPQT